MKIDIDSPYRDDIKLIISAFVKRLEDLDHWIEYAEEEFKNTKLSIDDIPHRSYLSEISRIEAGLEGLKKEKTRYENYLKKLNEILTT